MPGLTLRAADERDELIAHAGPEMDVLLERIYTLEEASAFLADWEEVVPLTTDAQRATASLVLQKITGYIKQAEVARKEAIAPYRAVVDAANSATRKPRSQLEAIAKALRARLAEAQEKELLRREEAQKEAMKAAASGDLEAANLMIQVSAPQIAEQEEVSYRWTWEVESFDLSKVPVEFLQLDMAKVRAYIKSVGAQGTPDVDGLTFKRKAIPIVKGR